MKTKIQTVTLNELRERVERHEEMMSICEPGERGYEMADEQRKLWQAALDGVTAAIDGGA